MTGSTSQLLNEMHALLMESRKVRADLRRALQAHVAARKNYRFKIEKVNTTGLASKRESGTIVTASQSSKYHIYHSK